MAYRAPRVRRDHRGWCLLDPNERKVLLEVTEDAITIAAGLDLFHGEAQLVETAVTLGDDTAITLGAGADVVIEWDTAATPDQLQFRPAADDTVFSLGVPHATQKSFDLAIYGEQANGGSSLYADASADTLIATGYHIQLKDNAKLVFGTGAGVGGDITLTYDANSLNLVPAGAADVLELGAASHALNTTLIGTLTVGVNDSGHDVKLFSATSGSYLLFDESEDELKLNAVKFTALGAVTVGVNGTGHDVLLYGDTAGCSLLWDQSEDQLVVTGPADVPALKIAGAGSKSAAAFAAAGTAWADGGTPEFAADQMYLKIDVGGTVYRLPLWADA